MALLSKGIIRQNRLLHSASAAILLLATSSSSLLFSPSSAPSIISIAKANRSQLLSTGISRDARNRIPFVDSWHLNQRSFYSATKIMSTAPDIDIDHKVVEEQQQKIEQNHQSLLLLPYVDGSHRSAKITIPPASSSSCVDTNDNNSSESNGSCIKNNGRSILADYNIMPITEFKQRLDATIVACKQLGKSALWIEVPMSHARFIEAMECVEGLNLHHISSEKHSIHLCMWLEANVENKIPEYATHQVGVGAMVVNSRDGILCVRELRKNYRPWKIPGGLADLGEQLEEAAIREVREETGIDCEFQSVLGFRHTHGLQFGRSDLYFVCRLSPIESKDEETGEVIIPEPIAEESEIAAVAWIPLQEYRDMVNGVITGEPHPMMQQMISLHDLEENDIQRTVINSIIPGRKPSPLYHVKSK